ncbi:TMN9, partial [Symbiodinium necroappetens]
MVRVCCQGRTQCASPQLHEDVHDSIVTIASALRIKSRNAAESTNMGAPRRLAEPTRIGKLWVSARVPFHSRGELRQIPAQAWFMQPLFTCAIGGILPFGAVFTELFFIMSSLWQHQFYYLFGFLALVLVILLITCAEISIALTYFQLTAENYNWWWRSFLASGSSAVYVFLYSMMYFSSRLQIDKV